MADAEDKLDEDYMFYLSFTSSYLGKLQGDKDQELCQAWLKKLSELPTTKEGKRNRNVFLSRLVLALQEGEMSGPFLKQPPCASLPNAFEVFGPPQPKIEVPPEFSKVDESSDLNTVFTSKDGKTYVATKSLGKGHGAFTYIGISLAEDEPQWVGGKVKDSCPSPVEKHFEFPQTLYSKSSMSTLGKTSQCLPFDSGKKSALQSLCSCRLPPQVLTKMQGVQDIGTYTVLPVRTDLQMPCFSSGMFSGRKKVENDSSPQLNINRNPKYELDFTAPPFFNPQAMSTLIWSQEVSPSHSAFTIDKNISGLSPRKSLNEQSFKAMHYEDDTEQSQLSREIKIEEQSSRQKDRGIIGSKDNNMELQTTNRIKSLCAPYSHQSRAMNQPLSTTVKSVAKSKQSDDSVSKMFQPDEDGSIYDYYLSLVYNINDALSGRAELREECKELLKGQVTSQSELNTKEKMEAIKRILIEKLKRIREEAKRLNDVSQRIEVAILAESKQSEDGLFENTWLKLVNEHNENNLQLLEEEYTPEVKNRMVNIIKKLKTDVVQGLNSKLKAEVESMKEEENCKEESLLSKMQVANDYFKRALDVIKKIDELKNCISRSFSLQKETDELNKLGDEVIKLMALREEELKAVDKLERHIIESYDNIYRDQEELARISMDAERLRKAIQILENSISRTS